MKTTNKRSNWIISVLSEKCPNCGQTHVFERGSGIFQMPVMKERCEKCHYRFDREPGYFLGAMYISYGIAVLLGILTFLFMHFTFPSLPLIWTPIAILFVILLIAKKNYKLSRIIYIHIFPW
jgi:uncharacterized protein (DUF983 family)